MVSYCILIFDTWNSKSFKSIMLLQKCCMKRWFCQVIAQIKWSHSHWINKWSLHKVDLWLLNKDTCYYITYMIHVRCYFNQFFANNTTSRRWSLAYRSWSWTAKSWSRSWFWSTESWSRSYLGIPNKVLVLEF